MGPALGASLLLGFSGGPLLSPRPSLERLSLTSLAVHPLPLALCLQLTLCDFLMGPLQETIGVVYSPAE